MILDLHDRIELLEWLPKGGRVAEIGVLYGGYSQHIYNIVQPDELHLIDPWEEVWAEGVKQDINEVLGVINHRFGNKDNVFIHRMRSLEAADKFPDRYFDWVYIDANHQYDMIKADLLAWVRKVKKWIIGHDFQSDDNFGTSVVRAVIETIQELGLEMIALTAFDDLPRKDGEPEAFPWGGRPLTYVLKIPGFST